ncbi:hypothetical protein [Streptomyces sp. NPDC006784]|uniref:hypothetical protein n=1 Tax=Streptomyces sp. NPDC006784 TaxID=3364764 RepID=UPI0036ABBAE6
MTNPYTAPIPPASRPPDTRPLRKRVLVWVAGVALFVAGVGIGATGEDGQQPVGDEARPATTVTATRTADPEPAPTVTETVKAKAKPRPTVTVTMTAAAKAADDGGDGGGGNSSDTSSGQGSSGTCSIVSNSGNCYSAGQYCRNGDHGATTSTASGRTLKCTSSRSGSWRWTYS